MQTFLPYPDAARSAAVLDDRRLGKQRVETLQVLRALHLDGYGWASHPAVTMWRGHTPALVAYGLAVVDAWCGRGYADTTRAAIAEFSPNADPTHAEPPPWWGDPALHRSHRAALLRKDPGHYRPWFGPDHPDDLPYVWPDPPVPARSPDRRSGWAVRDVTPSGRITLPVAPEDVPWVPLDVRRGRITKRLRQVARLTDEMAPGDPVVLVGPDHLRVGHVAGPYRRVGGAHTRPVTWIGTLARARLAFSAALQDPQAVFPLHDEPLVEAAVRGVGG